MNLNDFKADFEKSVEFFKNDIAGLRTSRASVAMVEDISVEAYGTRQPIKAVASISIADPKTLSIEPWDKSIMQAVEKGIRESSLGINPVNDGRLIRIILPELTTERRTELTKILHQKAEAGRVSLRKVRQEVRDMIAEEEKGGGLGEDDKFRLQEDLDKIVKEFEDKVKDITEKKEKEINVI